MSRMEFIHVKMFHIAANTLARVHRVYEMRKGGATGMLDLETAMETLKEEVEQMKEQLKTCVRFLVACRSTFGGMSVCEKISARHSCLWPLRTDA